MKHSAGEPSTRQIYQPDYPCSSNSPPRERIHRCASVHLTGGHYITGDAAGCTFNVLTPSVIQLGGAKVRQETFFNQALAASSRCFGAPIYREIIGSPRSGMITPARRGWIWTASQGRSFSDLPGRTPAQTASQLA